MKILDFLKLPYEDNEEDAKTECLWCGAKGLSVSLETPHQFQCWSCKQKGNAYTLIQKYYDDLPTLTRKESVALAKLKPGPKPKAYREIGVKAHRDTYVWPVRNDKGTIVCLYRLSPDNVWFSSAKPCSLTLLGLQNLKGEGTIWIPEGHWDYAACLSHLHTKSGSILGLCGSSFPQKHLHYLTGRDVIFLADNDEAGRKGVDTLARKMKSRTEMPSSLKYLDWSQVTLPKGEVSEGYDIRDLVQDLGL